MILNSDRNFKHCKKTQIIHSILGFMRFALEINIFLFHFYHCVCFIRRRRKNHFPIRILDYCRMHDSFIFPEKKISNLPWIFSIARCNQLSNNKPKKKTDWILMCVLFYLLKYYTTLNLQYASVRPSSTQTNGKGNTTALK